MTPLAVRQRRQLDNRERSTTVECVNLTGWSIPSSIIFVEKVRIEGRADVIKAFAEHFKFEVSQKD
jgi:hypothetical protein